MSTSNSASPEAHDDDPGIKAGTAKGVPYLVIIVFLCISFYKYVFFSLHSTWQPTTKTPAR